MAVFVKSNRDMVTDYLAYKHSVDYATSTAAEKADSLAAINDGYRRYLTGEWRDDTGATQDHIFTFIKQTAQLTLVTDDDDYDLPDSYDGDIDGYVYDEDDLVKGWDLEVVDHAELLRFRRDDDTQGLPLRFTVRAKDYAVGTGSTYEWLCWPKPTSTENGLTITYRYRLALADLNDSDSEYPAGLVGVGRLIVQAAKMLDEQDLSSQDGAETTRFYRLMSEMVRRDNKVIPGRILQDRIEIGGDRRWPYPRR